MGIYFNPVRVIESDNWRIECAQFMKDLEMLNPLVLTSVGNLSRLGLDKIFNSESIYKVENVNPDFESCQEAVNFALINNFDSLLAIGGGSVMDTAKVVKSALCGGFKSVQDLLEEKILHSYVYMNKSIFIPTTHGSGSEVTMWATIWDKKTKKKHSIEHIVLYPDLAILDGSLTLSLPLDVSIITALDALSHSFESLWNKNANSKSTEYAITAICLILSNINYLKINPSDLKVRKNLLKASNIAGLAFSNTKTAAAHSISYPLTAHFNIPHGIAASITLLPLLNLNKSFIEKEINQIIKNLGIEGYDYLKTLINSIPKGIVRFSLHGWGIERSQLKQIAKESFIKGRMDNNIVDLNEMDVREILKTVF